MNLLHAIAQPVGWAARAVGGVQNALPGQGDSSLNQVGRAITSGTATLSNPTGLFTGSPAFTEGGAPNSTQPAPTGGGGGGGPVPQDGGGYYDPYTGTYTGAAAAQQNAAMLEQLQAQLGQLDPQQNIGLGNIGNSFNLQSNRLDEQRAQAERDYGMKTQQAGQGYSNARAGIMSNTRGQANALQRLLGLNGAGNSSAAYEAAPYAAGLMGSTQLNQAQQTFAGNRAALDTGWQDTQRGYGNAVSDLNNQRYQQENDLRSSIAQTRANILGALDQARNSTAHNSEIQTLLGQITQLGQRYANPVMRTADVKFAAPNLNEYLVNPNRPPANMSLGGPTQGGGQSDIAPDFLSLLGGGQQRDEFGNLIQA